MIPEIKAKINCVQYAGMQNLPIRKSGDRTASLAGGTNKTACVVYDEWFYDFKLCKGGDVIDLCALINHNGDKSSAIKELSQITGVNAGADNWRAYTNDLNALIDRWHNNLRDDDRAYLHSRRVTDKTISRLKIGYNGRLVIPYFKNGYVAYYISRGEDPKYKKAKMNGLNENVPWGLHTIKGADELIIAEGAFDAISFEQEGYSVLATMGGHFSKEQLKTVLGICRQHKKTYICFDNDEAGNGFTVNFSKILFENNIEFMRLGLPPKYKDVSEYYEKGGQLNELIRKASSGLMGLCERIESKEEFKEFAYKACRFVQKPELSELFECAKGKFEKTWFEQVRKIAMSSPSDDYITKEVIKKHKLRYIETLGFYEYERGSWVKKCDTEIEQYISCALGAYRSGGKIASVLKLVKSDCISNEIFNTKPFFNFINGTLNLDTYEFKEHDEDDMCSMQVKYAYNKNKDCPMWKEFIAQICNFDEKRIALLQEIAGYVLFSDNSLQKCFFLQGDGGNGKSIFLNVLTELFGEDNVSNIEMSGLVEPFQRIQLLNSILNISTETQTNVRGAESIFKQIVVGDRINGCYKNKDFIDFRSRAKFVLACNEYIKNRDMTHGFIRRICFVKFENRFVSEPAGPNEFKADKDIEKKLLREKPGIFNWVLCGYVKLRQNMEFTKTDDEDELIKDFSQAINPVLVFIEESSFKDRINYKTLYEEYKNWCVDAGHVPKNRTGFVKAFKSAFLKDHPEYAEFKTNSVRGLVKFAAESEKNAV